MKQPAFLSSICTRLTAILCSILFSGFIPASAQFKKNAAPLPIAADCKNAVRISVDKMTHYGPTLPPDGYGELQEVNGAKSGGKLFDKEHHSAWYVLDIARDGELIFEIVPLDSLNDYDFILYEYDSTFCSNYTTRLKAPLRSNISRYDTSNKSITGLSGEAMNQFHAKGPGSQFSQSVTVKKGKQYLLVLDNVYPGGKGHTIKFDYLRDIVISGTVLDPEGKPLLSQITFSDYQGKQLLQTTTNAAGSYHLDLSVMEGRNYNITFMNDSSFVNSLVINTEKLAQNQSTVELKAILPKLRKGNKYNLKNINFQPGLQYLLPESIGSVEALYMLMKKNKRLKILVEGHVNAPGTPEEARNNASLSLLSISRAKTVQDFLLARGISPNRISILGRAATRMLYPNAQSEDEQKANRRVEIMVTSLDE